MFGKWHMGKEGLYLPENRGFDVSWVYASGSRMQANISHNGKKQKMAGTYPTDLFFKKFCPNDFLARCSLALDFLTIINLFVSLFLLTTRRSETFGFQNPLALAPGISY